MSRLVYVLLLAFLSKLSTVISMEEEPITDMSAIFREPKELRFQVFSNFERPISFYPKQKDEPISDIKVRIRLGIQCRFVRIRGIKVEDESCSGELCSEKSYKFNTGDHDFQAIADPQVIFHSVANDIGPCGKVSMEYDGERIIARAGLSKAMPKSAE